jgi:uncharacterized protein YgbK (DUF1537 family)
MNDFILADDLSGALDAAAAFHAAGWTVTVALSMAAWPRVGAGELVAFTTETRNAAPSVAAATVARAIEHGRASGGRLVYKKIDSTLRGPVAAELAALMRESPGVRVLFAPANPAVGRTVRDGVLLVHGVPVSETEFGRDAVSPVTESDVRSLLGDAATERVIVPDAATAADLTAAVARMDEAGADWVGVGSGALARPIASRKTGDRRQKTGDGRQGTGDRRQETGDSTGERAGAGDRRCETGDPSRGSGTDDRSTSVPLSLVPCLPSPDLSPVACLMVCGSAHAANREQAAALSIARGVPWRELRPGAPSAATGAAIADIRNHQGAALLIEEQRHGDSADVVRSIAFAVAEVLSETAVRRVFVTGGETAFALCSLLGVTTLSFQAEIESGLSLSAAETPGGRSWFAIKPGGFGDAMTWVRAWDALQRT